MITYDPYSFFNTYFQNPSALDNRGRRGQVELLTWFDKILTLLHKPRFSYLKTDNSSQAKPQNSRSLGSTLAVPNEHNPRIDDTKSISKAESTGIDCTMRNQNFIETKEKLKAIVNSYHYDDENPQELLTIKALGIISKLEAPEFLPDLISLFLKGGHDSSIYEKVVETILALDPDLTNEAVRSAIVQYLENDVYPHPIIKAIIENQSSDKFTWLKERVEQKYSDSKLNLQLNDLKFLQTLAVLKPKIAGYSEQLAEVFMMNQGDDVFKHAAIDVLNSYFPESGITFKSLINDHIARISLSEKSIDLSLLRKMKHYTGEQLLPSWDTNGHLKSEFLDLEKVDSRPSVYKLGGSILTYDDSGKPKHLKNKDKNLSLEYFYEEDGTLKATLVRYQDKVYPFVLDGDQIHAFNDLPDNPILCGTTNYPSMKLLNDNADQMKPFVIHEPGSFVLYADGSVQVDDAKTIIVSPSGSVHISDNAGHGDVEFITSTGDYHHLEPYFN